MWPLAIRKRMGASGDRKVGHNNNMVTARRGSTVLLKYRRTPEK